MRDMIDIQGPPVLFMDFHSHKLESLLFVQKQSAGFVPDVPGFVTNMHARSGLSTDQVGIRPSRWDEEDEEPKKHVNAKRFFFDYFNINSITYEVSDYEDPTITHSNASALAQAMMEEALVTW